MWARVSQNGAPLFLLAMTMVPGAFAADEISSLQAAFLREEYGTVSARAKEMVDQANPSDRDDLLYLWGVSALKIRDLESARTSMERLLSEYPNSPLAIQAQMALGDVWVASDQHEKGLASYQTLQQDPRAKPLAIPLTFRIGQTQRRLGLWEEAKKSFQEILSQAPNSFEAAQADQLLKSEDFYFSVQVGAFGTEANAQRLKAELLRRGYQVAITDTALEGRRLHRVRVGRYARRQEAQEEAQRLKSEGFPGKVVP